MGLPLLRYSIRLHCSAGFGVTPAFVCVVLAPVDYLGSEVICVVSLCSSEISTRHSFRHVNPDHQALYCLPHGLFGSNCDVQATAWSRLKKTDALLHINWNGHETEGRNKHRSHHNDNQQQICSLQPAASMCSQVNKVTREDCGFLKKLNQNFVFLHTETQRKL